MGSRRLTLLTRRFTLLAVLSLVVGLAPLGGGPSTSRAQEGESKTAAITPADAVFYGRTTYDPANPDWPLVEDLYARAWGEMTVDVLAMWLYGFSSGTFPAFQLGMPELAGTEVAIVFTDNRPVYKLANHLAGVDLTWTLLEAIGSANPLFATDEPTGASYLIAAPDPALVMMFADSAMYGMSGGFGVTVTTSDYQGVTISAAPPKPDMGWFGYAYALVGDVVVVSTHAETIEEFIDVQTGATPSIASDETYGAVAAALPADAMAFAVLSGPEFHTRLANVDDPYRPIGVALSGLLPATSTLGITLAPLPEGMRIDTVDIPVDGGSVEAAGGPADLTFGANVPADAGLYMEGLAGGIAPSTSVAASLAFGALAGGLGLPSLGQASDLTAYFGDVAGVIGLDPANAIAGFDGKYVLAGWGLDSLDPVTANVMVMAESNDAGVIGAGLAGVLTLAPGLLGVTAASEEGPDGMAVATVSGDAGSLRVGAGAVGGSIVLATNDAIDLVGSAPDATIADNPEYASSLELLPADYDGVLFMDLATVGRLRPVGGSGVEAPVECGNYAGRDAAQAAFDADPVGLAILDSNGNGTVCDDYMGQPVAAAASGPGITSLTMVSYVEGGLRRTAAIVRIG